MMVARVVIGQRGAESGLWVSKNGVDALTGADSNMLLRLTAGIEQFIMIGSAAGLPASIPLGLTQRPLVLLTRTNYLPAIGYTCFVSPFPFQTDTSTVYAAVTASTLAIAGSASGTVHYTVLRRLFS